MPRATKREHNLHEQAEQMLWGNDKPMRHRDRIFVFENWLPYIAGRVDTAAAFFTPWELATTVAFCSGDRGAFVDVCAGIGALSYALACQDWSKPDWRDREITAVEFNAEFVRVGRRLLPEVEWLHADVLDMYTWQTHAGDLRHWDFAVSNPPFGRPPALKRTTQELTWLNYTGAAEFMIAEICLRISDAATLILPQTSVEPLHRRSHSYDRRYPNAGSQPMSGDLAKFTIANPGASFSPTAFTTEFAQAQWRGVSPTVELIYLEFDINEQSQATQDLIKGTKPKQLSLI